MSARNTKSSATNVVTIRGSKQRASRNIRQPCFTMKRPILFQVRKSLVEYVDEEFLAMNTSVFYQRIFILAKNVEPPRTSQVQLATVPHKKPMGAHKAAADESTGAGPDSTDATSGVKSDGGADVMHFDLDSNVELDDGEGEEEQEEELIEEVKPADIPDVKDAFVLFSEKLQYLAKYCMKLSYTPDPMCGLLVYMNDYTMLMLESGEDMMGIFCGELLKCVGEFWQSNRVVMIEDHIKQLYTKELVFRRIPAAFLNEKFPPSTPTDEYLMGKQHLIIKDKMHTICRLISQSLEPLPASTSQGTVHSLYSESDVESEGNQWGFEEEGKPEQTSAHPSVASVQSTILSPDTYRKWLPEIQRIELVLASTRFYYTLQEFFELYGTVPYARDDDSFWWPIQNNYAPPNIFRRSPFDINLTFAEYAAEMARLMQEEADRHKAEQEAAEQAEAAAAEAAAEAAGSKPAKAAKEEEE